MSYKIVTSVIAGLLSISAVGAVTNINNSETNKNQSSVQSSIIEQPKKAPEITEKEVVETSAVPYETKTYDNANLASGSTRVDVEGQDGVRTKKYKVTYTDGKETNRELISSEITTEPVTKVVAKGTYVAPKAASQSQYCENGTYVNSAGNTVCRPSNNNTGGATAICRDGTYSYSQSRRGTCSHHGGVKTWL